MSEKQIRNRVAAVIVEEGKILLIKHQKEGRQYWLLPGGGVEFGETLEQTGVRELKEETGLDVRLGDLLFVLESIPPDQHRHVINYYFEGSIQGGEIQLGEEAILCDLQWHHIEDLPHLVLFPDTAREILEYLETGTIKRRSLGCRWS